MCHGIPDNVVLYKWGEKTFDTLKYHGIDGRFQSYPNIYHELHGPAMNLVKEWIENLIPE